MTALEITPGPQKAPHGPELNCKDWHAEAALRMFLNNLDAEVAEQPYGVCAGLRVELIAETGGEQRGAHPLPSGPMRPFGASRDP